MKKGNKKNKVFIWWMVFLLLMLFLGITLVILAHLYPQTTIFDDFLKEMIVI